MADGQKKTRARVIWSGAKTAAFMETLAATCNVRAACRAAGVRDTQIVYERRRRDPEFVKAWGDALALGYQMLETQLIGHALAKRTRLEPLDDGELPAVDVDLALKLLKDHRDRPGKPKGGRPLSFAAPEDTNRVLLHKLDMLEKARAIRLAREAAAAPSAAEEDAA